MKNVLLIVFSLLCGYIATAQNLRDTASWHGRERTVRYHPEGGDFVIANGNRRFTRALYGTNTAFRVEAGDLPEFALYMPGMGGNMKFGLSGTDTSKWLIDADSILARYRPGSMLYDIRDKMLGKGILHLVILALGDAEGVIIKMRMENADKQVKLVWTFGGASGKKFSRDGDMGPDPESSFYLKPEYCSDNSYNLVANTFLLKYGTGLVAEWDPYVNKNFATDTVKPVKNSKEQQLAGFVPFAMSIHIGDATEQASPDLVYASKKEKAPLVTGRMEIKNNEWYFFDVQNPNGKKSATYSEAEQIFAKAELARKNIADRIKILTPDPYINTLGGVLGTAADAIWESPSFLHGSIGWRMRLNGWRGPYVADVLSWHDRARSHFESYALSQITSPLSGPVIMDTALHLARSLEKMGTSVFSSGYISRNPGGDLRPHHYDMNLVYINALLRHFHWTGNISFARKMWPVITRHLAWEKRNFDSDDDGLYDAYASIWASDALEYSGGSVTHSSAYNYKANKEAALIANWIGEDARPYEAEATKILKAINTVLWMPSVGNYAEYRDLLGNKMLHPSAALWTIYHSLDSDVPDKFQAWQSMKYIDDNIPHIPVRARGIEKGFYTLSTTKWMPYDWSLNNVATAEVMHTALANWQAGRNDEAFTLWKSELLSTMYLGGSPGNIGQISFYDAARGESYRDFADPVAMTARSTVEGLFGILPDAIHGELFIRPGFPSSWNMAAISLPDISIDFKKKDNEETYIIIPAFAKRMRLKLLIKLENTRIKSVTVNGKKVEWKNSNDAIGTPGIEIMAGIQDRYLVKIVTEVSKTIISGHKDSYIQHEKMDVHFPGAFVQDYFDPQHILLQPEKNKEAFTAIINTGKGNHLFFVQLRQNDCSWWEPVETKVVDRVEITTDFHQSANDLRFSLANNTSSPLKGNLVVNAGSNSYTRPLELAPYTSYVQMNVGAEATIPGSNEITFSTEHFSVHQDLINWNAVRTMPTAQALDLSNYYNDKVTHIFKNQYLSPRPATATLQLPVQGIGDWTHPLKTATIDDSGLRKLAGENNRILLPQGIPFSTPSDTMKNNILFTSQWDNYPKEAVVPLTGKASHAYLLMAGSTNPMQSRIVNGAVIMVYTDHTADTLWLKNPQTWWPIEQDYMDDGYAFTIDAPRPVRVHLKTGKIVSDYDNTIEAYAGKMIDGGAATVLDIIIKPYKTLKEMKLQAIANDVVIGLMAITLIR